MHSYEDHGIGQLLHAVATYFGSSGAISETAGTLEVVNIAYHSWVGDEFSKGGWMMNPPRFCTTNAVELRQALGNIHFAGNDVLASEPGSIEGAIFYFN